MYALHLRNGKRVTSAVLQHTLSKLDCGTLTHITRMQHLSAIERLEARGMQYSNQDFDVLSSALNFLDAVDPEHGLRDEQKQVVCTELIHPLRPCHCDYCASKRELSHADTLCDAVSAMGRAHSIHA